MDVKLNNMKNSLSERSNTGYKGITFVRNNGLFQAQVVVYSTKKKSPFPNGDASKLITIQKTAWSREYNTLKEAIKAREEYIKSLF